MPNAQEFLVPTVSDLKKVSEHVGSLLSERTVILLTGPMGVGKTEFVRSLVSSLIGEAITSPSFAIHNNYSAGKLSVDHLDLFRIEGEDDLESTGFWDLFANKSGLIILEWADKLDANLLPKNWKQIRIDFSFIGDSKQRLLQVSS